MSTDNLSQQAGVLDSSPPVMTFEQAFNQALNSLDLKGTLGLTLALVQKSLFMLEEQSKQKSNIIKPTALVL